MEGREPNGVRSDRVDEFVRRAGFDLETREGEEVSIAVEEVGTGVGYVVCSSNASRFLFRGLGRAGEEEKGSNAGSKDDVVLFGGGFGETAVSETVVKEAMGCWSSAIESDSRGLWLSS